MAVEVGELLATELREDVSELFLLAGFGEFQGDGADVGLRDRLVLGLRSLGRRSRGLGLRNLDRLFRRESNILT